MSIPAQPGLPRFVKPLIRVNMIMSAGFFVKKKKKKIPAFSCSPQLSLANRIFFSYCLPFALASVAYLRHSIAR